MDQQFFSEDQVSQIRDYGLTIEDARRQVYFLRHPVNYIELDRACTVGDGIRRLTAEEQDRYFKISDSAQKDGRMMKFVPASGAGTRMFKSLLSFRGRKDLRRGEVEEAARKKDSDAVELLGFMDRLREFAFFGELEALLREKKGMDVCRLVEDGSFGPILDFLFSPEGLDYENLPKGLLQFHSSGEGGRTAVEEQFSEAVAYVRDGEGNCRIHFTVSSDYLDLFRERGAAWAAAMEKAIPGVRFRVSYSVQEKSTDTVAVDSEGAPFTRKDGSLLFRPGGHGSLLRNLSLLAGQKDSFLEKVDIIFIKNIDNVVPGVLRAKAEEQYRWKRRLAGIVVELQDKVHRAYADLKARQEDSDLLRACAEMMRLEFGVDFPERLRNATHREKKHFLFKKLNRPIRVCGMVRNLGDPGGGPFWVRHFGGEISLQVVEKSQVDPGSPGQQEILKSSTHFNPVDFVCGVRNRQGEPFELMRYVDPNAVFVARKTHEGRELKAFEHPGLWNGGMADWNTVFVEVPRELFNPVKTLSDLLRSEHRVPAG